jgi:hypothetical protein
MTRRARSVRRYFHAVKRAAVPLRRPASLKAQPGDPDSKFPTKGQECVKGCGRWRQGRDGLCRRCQRLELARVMEAAPAARLQQPQPVREFPPAGSPKTRMINGVEFEVVFDGT